MMNSKSNIISELNEVIKREEEKRKETKTNGCFVSANDYYNKLIKSGIIKKKGFTLRGIEDTHLFNVKLNGY